MKIQVDGSGVEDFDASLHIDAGAAALEHRGETIRAFPFIAPELERPVLGQPMGKQRAPISIAGPDERDIRTVLVLLNSGEPQRPMQGWISRHRQIADMARPRPLQRFKARSLLDDEPIVVPARQLPPVGQMSVVLNEPHRGEKFLLAQMLEYGKIHRRLGKRQHKIRRIFGKMRDNA